MVTVRAYDAFLRPKTPHRFETELAWHAFAAESRMSACWARHASSLSIVGLKSSGARRAETAWLALLAKRTFSAYNGGGIRVRLLPCKALVALCTLAQEGVGDCLGSQLVRCAAKAILSF